jgi:hypothetical protein
LYSPRIPRRGNDTRDVVVNRSWVRVPVAKQKAHEVTEYAATRTRYEWSERSLANRRAMPRCKWGCLGSFHD